LAATQAVSWVTIWSSLMMLNHHQNSSVGNEWEAEHLHKLQVSVPPSI